MEKIIFEGIDFTNAVRQELLTAEEAKLKAQSSKARSANDFEFLKSIMEAVMSPEEALETPPIPLWKDSVWIDACNRSYADATKDFTAEEKRSADFYRHF